MFARRLKFLGEKSKGGGQEMAAMMLILRMVCTVKNLLALTSFQPFVGRHL